MTFDPITSALQSVYSDLSPGSRRVYECNWTRYVEWLATQDVGPLEATPKVIKQHVAWLREQKNRDGKPFSKSTISGALSSIREIYRELVNDEVIEVNPAREAKTPKIDGAPKAPYLDEEQITQLIDAQPTKTWRERRDKLVIQTLFGLGWRRSEVARLRGEDFEGSVVYIGRDQVRMAKGSKQFAAKVPDWLLEEITQWRKYAGIEESYLFPRSQDDLERPITGDIIYDIVKKAAARAGLAGKIAPHGLRRSNITISGELGVPLKARQLAVGHASGSTTERYDRARDATAVAPGDVFADMMRPKQRR